MTTQKKKTQQKVIAEFMLYKKIAAEDCSKIMVPLCLVSPLNTHKTRSLVYI